MFIKAFTAEISQRGVLSENRDKARMKVALTLKERSLQRGLRKKDLGGQRGEKQKRVVLPWPREERNSCTVLWTQMDLEGLVFKNETYQKITLTPLYTHFDEPTC